MKSDIRNTDDIQVMVDTFYQKVSENKILGPIFNEVAKIDWSHHLPVMYAFWSSTLFGKMGYKGNPMEAHFQLNKKVPLTDEAFNTWKSLFIETVDELFVGEMANEAKKRAVSIADLMFFKIQNFNQSSGVQIGKIIRDEDKD